MSDEVSGNIESLRMTAKVAHLYHSKGLVQTDIAKRLNLSQARVSRLLAAAEENGIVRRIVFPPSGLFSEVERQLEEKFGLQQVHVVDAVGENEDELTESLGMALVSAFEIMPIEGKKIGLNSATESLQAFVESLPQSQRIRAHEIVELLGDIGEPFFQHLAATTTTSFAKRTNATPIFLRVPGLVSSPNMKQALLESDIHARQAMREYKKLDIALIGVGSLELSANMGEQSNFLTAKQFKMAREAGAVGEINLRFINEDGEPVKTELDDLVIGISLEELRNIDLKIGVSGGITKRRATLAIARGKWVNVLVTDSLSAQFLLES